MNNEVWVLGATGRTGRMIAGRLDEAGVPLVLVGRDRERLEGVAAGLDGVPRLVVGSLESTLSKLAQDAPGVVVNTVGPFTTTGVEVARACPPGTHYVDIANEFAAVENIVRLDRQAAARDQVLVTGAGFGVLATESVVLRLCQGRPRPKRVRVDALASVALEGGVIGSALAATIVEVVAFGGREVRQGRLVRSRSAAHPVRLRTPDGDVLGTGGGANGELIAAWRASDADCVIAASTAAPTSDLARFVLPAVEAILRIPVIGRFAINLIARIPLRAQEMSRPSSWGHARAEWSDGTVGEGWLRVGDGMAFTASVTAEVIQRLLKGEGRPGSHTPGALFGLELAEAVGGEFIIDQGISSERKGLAQMPTNTAAWLPAKRAKLEVKSAPYTHPRENEIVVKNHAVAINPLDWIIQVAGNLIFFWIKYPFILGSDSAGEVVEVGTGVTRFKVGDRVLGHAVGTDKKRNSAAEGAFQEYTVVLAHMAAPIPDTMPYENAAVLPLTLSTAACGLFQKDQLALQHPSANPKPTGKTLLVWGGSTSVGSNAIQLAVAAGYEVITTASPRNFDYVKKLGASQVFDYNSESVVKDIIAAVGGKTIAGALAIGTGSAEPCLDVVHACEGDKFVSIASQSVSLEKPLPLLITQFLSSNVSLRVRSRIRHIRTKMIFGSTLMDNEVSRVIYEDFLPQALAEGRYVAAPEPEVVGKGLEYVQTGLDIQKQGISARKVVVSL